MSDKLTNIIELRVPQRVLPATDLASAPSSAARAFPTLSDPAPFAEPTEVGALFADLVEDDGSTCIGLLAPPDDFAGWVLSPAQATTLGMLLIERAKRATLQP